MSFFNYFTPAAASTAPVTIAPPTEVASSFTLINATSGTINIPADVTEFFVVNKGGLDPNNTSTINGSVWPPQEQGIRWKKDEQGNTMKTSPAMTIVPNGNQVIGYYFT